MPTSLQLKLALVKWGIRLASLTCFAISWEFFASSANSLLLPSFNETVTALAQLIAQPQLWSALWISNQAMVLGFALAALSGVSLGLAMGRSRAVERIADPYLNILLVTPMAPLIPIIIMATGLGLVSRVLIVFTFAFVVITVNTRAGLAAVEPSWMEMAKSYGASEAQLWYKILLRAASPAILAGLRLGLARSITGMLVVELVLLALGLGRLILDYQGNFDSPYLYATVLVIIAEAFILMQFAKWFEHRAAPWVGEVVVE